MQALVDTVQLFRQVSYVDQPYSLSPVSRRWVAQLNCGDGGPECTAHPTYGCCWGNQSTGRKAR